MLTPPPPHRRRRVVITGIGVVSPNGVGAENFARACFDGVSGVSALRDLDLARLRSSVAAQVLPEHFDVGGVLLVIDAKGDRAAQWYAGYGAEPLQDAPLTLVMPLATFAGDLRARGLL